MDTKTRIRRALARARYAAIGAAIGAAAGGLFGRRTASTGGATGALVGAVVAEKKFSAGGWIDQVRGDDDEEESVVDSIKGKTEDLPASE